MLYKPTPSSSDDQQNGTPLLRISHERTSNTDLQWTPAEKRSLAARIGGLRDDQLAALLDITGLKFRKEDIGAVVHDIKTDGLASGHLEIFLAEADSKDNLLWWLSYFERALKN